MSKILFFYLQAHLKTKDIDNAFKKMVNTKSDSLFSCHKAEDYLIFGKRKNKYIPLTIDYKNRNQDNF